MVKIVFASVQQAIQPVSQPASEQEREFQFILSKWIFELEFFHSQDEKKTRERKKYIKIKRILFLVNRMPALVCYSSFFLFLFLYDRIPHFKLFTQKTTSVSIVQKRKEKLKETRKREKYRKLSK